MMAATWVQELTTLLRHTKLNHLRPDMLKGGKITRPLVQKSSSPKRPPRMSDPLPITSICHQIVPSEILLSLEPEKPQPGPWDKSAPRGEGIMGRSGQILRRILLQMRMTMFSLVLENICARNTPLNSIMSLTLCMTIRKISDPWSLVSRLKKQRT